MKEYAKEQVLKNEGNAWFDRNKNALSKQKHSKGFELISSFLKVNQSLFSGGVTLLEVGCSYGYNLAFINEEFGWKCIGIEPSENAVDYGNRLWNKKDITLYVGTSDNLAIEEESIDILVFGFCLYNVERHCFMKTLSEADRVLKEGGFLCIYDFDTSMPLRRDNKHNRLVPTYKMDMASWICGNPQYTLVEKRVFSHSGEGFCADMQERCSLSVFYKERIEDCYLEV